MSEKHSFQPIRFVRLSGQHLVQCIKNNSLYNLNPVPSKSNRTRQHTNLNTNPNPSPNPNPKPNIFLNPNVTTNDSSPLPPHPLSLM